MKASPTAPKNIDEYIATFPKEVQEILEKVRLTIRNAVPDAQEAISYQIPTFTLNGSSLIYFAGYKKHVGLYPAPIENAEFKAKLSPYASGKATAKFPLDKPIPFDLIGKIVKFKAKENLKRAEAKRKKR
jgi:uncharacterized protein YdhG (YjbR/CyaY superfamily)